MAAPGDYKIALKQLNDMEKSLISALESVVTALRDDGRIDLREGISIGSAGLSMGMNVAQMLQRLSADGAEHLVYVLKNSERVLPGTE